MLIRSVANCFFLFISISLLNSCTYTTKESHNKTAEKVEVVEEKESLKTRLNNSFSDEHLKLLNEIKESDSAGHLNIMLKLEQYIYSRKNKVNKKYSSKEYKSYLSIYSELLSQLAKVKSDREIEKAVKRNLAKFDKNFVSKCLTRESNCQFARDVLSDVAETEPIVYLLSLSKKKVKDQIDYLNFIFEINNSSREKTVSMLLMNRIIDLVFRNKKRDLSLKASYVRTLLFNLDYLLAGVDWSDVENNEKDFVALIFPEKKNLKYTSSLKRKPFSHLFLYFNQSSLVKKKVKDYVDKEIESKFSKLDLSSYPAYKDIQVVSEIKKDTFLSYAVFKSFAENFGISDFLEIMTREKITEKTVSDLSQLIRKLVRWEIASLSIYSSSFLSKQLKKKNNIDQKTIQEVINTGGHDLSKRWSYFLDRELMYLSKLLRSAEKIVYGVEQEKTEEFFFAVRRNILKTSVYPNMLAMFYYMFKVDWVEAFRVFWIDLTITKETLAEEFVAGKFLTPWFNFTKEVYREQRVDEIRTVLYSTEMIDAVYYFFSTKTFELYDIPTDDFISNFIESMFLTKKKFIKRYANFQYRYYIKDTQSGFSKWMSWCEKLGTDFPAIERVNLRGLKDVPSSGLKSSLTPFTSQLIHYDINGSPHWRLYYNDIYDSGVSDNITETGLPAFGSNEILDKIRLEYQPMLFFSQQVLDMMSRMNEKKYFKEPLKIEKSKKALSEVKFLVQSYLGVHKNLSSKMDSCLFKSFKEGERRIIETAYVEKQFLEDVVYPLAIAVSQEKISIKEANDFFVQLFYERDFPYTFKEFSEFYNQTFILSRSGLQNVRLSAITYHTFKERFLLRMSSFLRRGLVIGKESSMVKKGILKELNIPPVVGRHLIIKVPETIKNLQEHHVAVSGSHEGSHGFFYSYSFSSSSEKSNFSSKVVRDTFGHTYASPVSVARYVEWEMGDKKHYLDAISKGVENKVLSYYLSDYEYLDLSSPLCRELFLKSKQFEGQEDEVKKTCIKKSKPTTLVDVGQYFQKYFELFNLSKKVQDYFQLIGVASYIHHSNADRKVRHGDGVFVVGTYSDPIQLVDIRESYYVYEEYLGFWDYIFHLMYADYLGFVFQMSHQVIYNVKNKYSTGFALSENCKAYRNNCLWRNEAYMGLMNAYARRSRPGMLFPFDQKILEDSHAFIKERLDRKYGKLEEIIERRDELFNEVWGEDGKQQVLLDLSPISTPFDPFPLSDRYINEKASIDKYYYSFTGSFYLKDPDWKSYLNVGQ